MEVIRGPVLGFYLACYTIEVEGGYYAYAKICSTRPDNVWETRAERKVMIGPMPNADTAIDEVVLRATARLRARDAAFSRTLPLRTR